MNESREHALIAEIDRAFSGVRLDDGISLNMTEYNDSCGTAKEFLERAKSDEREDWHRISDATLEEFTVTFSFTDLKGFRFYIPAYMIWTLRNHRRSQSIIADFTIYAITPDHHVFQDIPLITWFTGPQLNALTKFLEYCCENDASLDAHVADKNLSKIRSRQTAG